DDATVAHPLMLRPIRPMGLPFGRWWLPQRFGTRSPLRVSSRPLTVLSRTPGCTGWVIGTGAGETGSVGVLVGVGPEGVVDGAVVGWPARPVGLVATAGSVTGGAAGAGVGGAGAGAATSNGVRARPIAASTPVRSGE